MERDEDGIVRILAIPAGKKKDYLGKELGDDWLLATLGTGLGPDGETECDYYITTNRVHASELDQPMFEPEGFCKFVVDKINENYRQFLEECYKTNE